MTARALARCSVVALACACAAGLSACGGSSDEDEVRAVAKEFRRALQADDGAAACRLLSAAAKRQFEGDCAEQVTSIDPGDPSTDGALTLIADRASLATRSGGRTRGIAFIKLGGEWRIERLPLSTAIVDEPPGRAAFFERCWKKAGAKIATHPTELAFAAADPPTTAVREDTVSVKGGDWRIFYTFAESGSDPGFAEVIKDPEVAGAVAYVENAASHEDVVARARACAD
jgi:hypothetical protein